MKRKHRTYGRLLIVTNVGRQAQAKRGDFLRSAKSLEGKKLHWAQAWPEVEFAVHYVEWFGIALNVIFLRGQHEYFCSEHDQARFYRSGQHG